MDLMNRPEKYMRIYFTYAKAGIMFIGITILFLMALLAGFLVFRGLWVAMLSILRAMGVGGH